MRQLLFLFAALTLTACSDDLKNTAGASGTQGVSLKTLNSKNDLQICYDPLNCFYMPQGMTSQNLDFLKPAIVLNETKLPEISTKTDPYDKFSPLAAKKIEEIKSLVKKPVTVTGFSRSPASIKPEGADFQVSGMKPETLKQFCKESGANNIRVYNSHIHCDWLSQPISMDFKPQPLDVQVKGELKSGETVRLSLNSFDKEASSQLAVEWKVQLAGKTVLSSNDPTLTLTDLKPGFYQVKAHTGDGQEENLSLVVE